MMGTANDPPDRLREHAAQLELSGWRDIATAPRDGSGFQAWLTCAGTGWWEPRCHFGTAGALGIWRRVGYDYGTESVTATHWMPRPSSPAQSAA